MAEVDPLSKLDDMRLRVAGIRKTSLVDGFGVNYVIFLQGCSHEPKCKGCHNPITHSATAGYSVTVRELFSDIVSQKLITGVTFSGGEPLDQYKAVVALAKLVRLKGYETTLYTGHLVDTYPNDLSVFNFIIDGKYDEDQKDITSTLRGSKNQRVLEAAINFPGLFTDIHRGTHIRQYIYAAEDIAEDLVLWADRVFY